MPEPRIVVDYVQGVNWELTDIYADHQVPPFVESRQFRFRNAGGGELPGSNPQYDVFRRVLSLLKEIDHPVRAELSDANVVLDLIVPEVGVVQALWPEEDGTVTVDLSGSAAPLVLRPDLPRFTQLLGDLERAMHEREPLIVSTTDDQEILDFQYGELKPRPAAEPLTGDEVLAGMTIVDPGRAEDLFTALATENCPIPTGRHLCIPFRYPDNGCWARAERMCDLLREQHNVEAGKVWLFGRLRAHTENRRDCRIRWRFHVAPVVRLDTGPRDLLVLDPSVCCRAETVAAWREALGDTRAVCELTDTTVYFQTAKGDGVEEMPGEMVDDLKYFLARLLCRARRRGAPPYRQCRGCANEPSGGRVEPREDPGVGFPLS